MVNRKTWHQITKHGLPVFEVVRPMKWSEELLEPGALMPPCDKYKLQRLYEQHAIKVREIEPEPKTELIQGEQVEFPKGTPHLPPDDGSPGVMGVNDPDALEPETETDPEIEPEADKAEPSPKPTKKTKKGR